MPTLDPSDVLRPLRRVRQIREYAPDPVDPAALAAIADVARWSGSSQNAQPWRFVVLSDREVLAAIAAAGMPQTRSLTSAPAAIVISMPEVEGRAVSTAYDEGRAAERILIAASLLELGAAIAWLSGDVRKRAAELLGLPSGRFVRTIVAIGHPSDAARRPKAAAGTARLPREETVRLDRW
jgi:nitroreductase